MVHALSRFSLLISPNIQETMRLANRIAQDEHINT